MKIVTLITVSSLLISGSILAESAKPLKTFAEMKIKEVTIFKDGHAFVLHSGKMPVNPEGNVVMDYLPAPVMGTYWPYSADKNADLRAVTAGKSKITVEKTALTIREMIEANIGIKVLITEIPSAAHATEEMQPYEATILELPTRSGEELEALNPSSSDEQLSVKGNVVMLKTSAGVKSVDFDRILNVTFPDKRNTKTTSEEFRNLLTLDLKWNGKQRTEADVGMIYLQRGLRWIPNYKIDIAADGKAMIKLQATLINELTDINDVTAHLVIGVPSFAFKDSVDPISLRKDVARLSSNSQNRSQTAFGFSNAIMSQSVMPSRQMRSGNNQGAGTMDLGPSIDGAKKSEDFFMFTVKNITLQKGERIVIPITEYELEYEDIYALDIPFTPPGEILRNLRSSHRSNLARMYASPKVKHKIRIANKSKHPFTTAPAMITKDGHIIAQGMMTYTSIGGNADIELTTAVDITVEKTDNETLRTPKAVNWNGDWYSQIDLEGKITLVNYKQKAVTVEITRYVLGNIDKVGQDGEQAMLNPFEDSSFLPEGNETSWWHSYSWPWWWYRFNGVGRITWTTTIEPTKSSEHTYSWHYFWN